MSILKRIVRRIRAAYPDIKITIRADSGFSCPTFYELADTENLGFVVGMATNEVLKRQVARAAKAVTHLYVRSGRKHQHFMNYTYQAKSWHKPQRCYAKVGSTGKSLNIRHFVSNLEGKTARQLYLDFYVQRGEASENRIKEVKIMCFANSLSNHRFRANFFRLLLSSLACELFVLLKQALQKTLSILRIPGVSKRSGADCSKLGLQSKKPSEEFIINSPKRLYIRICSGPYWPRKRAYVLTAMPQGSVCPVVKKSGKPEHCLYLNCQMQRRTPSICSEKILKVVWHTLTALSDPQITGFSVQMNNVG